MIRSHKILFNASALYIRIAIHAVVTILSTRILLGVLGVESFGLYNLIAGVIIFLSFFNGALTVSVQRFLSLAIGRKDSEQLKNIFNVSILIHLAIALLFICIMFSIKPIIFNGFLNISPHLLRIAGIIYNLMIASTVITLLTIPYNAIINAKEDMWFLSLSETITFLLHLCSALILLIIKSEYLITYAFLILLSTIIGTAMKFSWCKIKYKESELKISLMKNSKLFSEMIKFTSWNTLGSVSVVVRSQGVAVILNVFFGTLLNAAYGIANQVNSLVITFASTLTTVFTPIIIQTKGEGDDEKMKFISIFSSKISFLLSSILALPILIYTPFLLDLWLKEIPGHTIIFCRIIILSFLVMQLYPGLTRALYAIGDIKWYQIMVSIWLVSILPIGFILFKYNLPPYSILIYMALAQTMTLITTVNFAKRRMNLDRGKFLVNSVMLPSITFSLITLAGYYIKEIVHLENHFYQFLFHSIWLMGLYSLVYFRLHFELKERMLIKNLLNSLIRRVKK